MAPSLPVLHEVESATYDVLLDDGITKTPWESVEVDSRIEDNLVRQTVRSSHAAATFDVSAIIDLTTGEIKQRTDGYGITYPVGAEAQAPALANNYVLQPEPATPVVWALHGLAWMGASRNWTASSFQWGKWQATLHENPEGYWVNATTLCDDRCTSTPPTWKTSALFTTGYLPKEVQLSSTTKPHSFILTAARLTAEGQSVPVSARQPQLAPLHASDPSCLPLPCEGSLAPSFRYAHAFAALQQTPDWQTWQQQHPSSQLDTLAIAHRPEGSTLAGPVPVNGTVWIFRFQSREGPIGTFTLQSLDSPIGPTPPVLSAAQTTDASSLTPFVTFDAQFATAEAALASALAPTIQADLLQHPYSVLLDVGYGILTPEPIARSRWFVVNLDSEATTVSSGHDGRLLGAFPHSAPSYL